MPVPEVGPEHAPHRPGTVSIPQQQSRDQRTREHQPREYQSREHQSREHQPREYQPRDRRTSEQLSGEQRDPLGDPEDDPFAYFAPARPYLPAEPYQLVEPRRPVDSRREVEFGGAGPRSDAEAGPSAVGEAASGEAAVGEAAAQEVATPEVATPEAGPAEPRSASRSERSQSRAVARWVEPGALAAQQAQRARTGALVQGDRKAAARRSGRRVPTNGWRRMLFTLSGGLINPGEGPVELRRRELTTRVNQPLHGCYKVAMLSLKGGVGKTTVTATLGATFASLRGDRVIAVDANPDRGTLSQKIPLETSATVSHLLRDSQRVRRYIDVRAYTSQGPSRLEVLASEQDPAVSEAFSEQDYRRAVTLLEHFYNIVLTDCGTGLMHSAMYGVLGMADALVIVSSGSIDGARSASATMDWLDAHGHRDLVSNSVAVINSVRRSSGQVDLNRVAEHFAARCRAVVRIPYDSHLEEGAELDVDRLAPATRTALLELAASVADVFPRARE
jgi:MinD-like ATPase involved in chromosome partitioning or flagellar assembly